jgi:aspartokinase
VSTILICLVSISQVEVIHNCSILAAVGLRMASTPGVSATLFDALAKVFCTLNLVPEIFFMVLVLIYH